MAVPEYIENLDTGKEFRDALNLAIHRALRSAHEWEPGHDGDYCIYNKRLWWFDGSNPNANRNDTPGESNSNNNGSWNQMAGGEGTTTDFNALFLTKQEYEALDQAVKDDNTIQKYVEFNPIEWDDMLWLTQQEFIDLPQETKDNPEILKWVEYTG